MPDFVYIFSGYALHDLVVYVATRIEHLVELLVFHEMQKL
jgi:hypothetical protein